MKANIVSLLILCGLVAIALAMPAAQLLPDAPSEEEAQEEQPASVDLYDNKPENSTLCKDKKDGTLLADPKDRSYFYECNSGLTFKFHCPDGLLFDETRKACAFDPNQPTKRPPYHGESKFDCKGKKDGFYPDEKDVTKFHECVNGYPYDFTCPPTTIYDAKRQACSYDTDPSSHTTSGPAVETTTEHHRETRDTPTSTTAQPTTEQHRETRDTPTTTTVVPSEPTTEQHRETRDTPTTTVVPSETTTRGRHH